MFDLVRQPELASALNWHNDSFLLPATSSDLDRFPVSFCYNDQPSVSLLQGWTASQRLSWTANGVTVESIVFTDAITALECRCEVKIYRDYPVLEWVAYFKNAGTADTPVLSDIQPLDVFFPLGAGAPCQVYHTRGGLSQQNDFEPLVTPLTFRQGGSRLELSALTGKSSTLHLPFFNLQLGNGGVIGAIGWSGGWTATFQRLREGIRVRAGMERTHLRLHPGEEIRTPAHPAVVLAGDRRLRWHHGYVERSHPQPEHVQTADPCALYAAAKRTSASTAVLRWGVGRTTRSRPSRENPMVEREPNPDRVLLDRCGLVWRSACRRNGRRTEQRLDETSGQLGSQFRSLPARLQTHR